MCTCASPPKLKGPLPYSHKDTPTMMCPSPIVGLQVLHFSKTQPGNKHLFGK